MSSEAGPPVSGGWEGSTPQTHPLAPEDMLIPNPPMDLPMKMIQRQDNAHPPVTLVDCVLPEEFGPVGLVLLYKSPGVQITTNALQFRWTAHPGDHSHPGLE